MRFAILGTRGIPANYGGFETFAEALAVRLVQRGHDVTVYGRSNYISKQNRVYKGVRLVVLPTIRHKYLDTPANTFLSTLHILFQRYDVIFYCNSANSFCTWIPRLVGKKVILNVDGLEWKRAKWSWFGQMVYRYSEFLSTFLPNHIVTDAREVQKYYFDKFNKKSTYIPYGANIGRVYSKDVLKRYGLKKDHFILYVSRLEPENNAHIVIQAYEEICTDVPLVIVGDAPYSREYIRRLKCTKDARILFTGYVFGNGYHALQSSALCYIQATEVGGTHPALVEAMGHGNCILANDVPEHREVLDSAGIYFNTRTPGDLTIKLQYILNHPEEIEKFRFRAFERARQKYTWEKVTDDYEKLFVRIGRGRKV
jgi:glycosyltransferase involved in cell wall biosynthesis